MVRNGRAWRGTKALKDLDSAFARNPVNEAMEASTMNVLLARKGVECWEIIDFKPAADDWACPSFSKVNTASSTTCLVVEKRVSLQTCRISWLKDVRNSKAWTSGILQFGRFVAARQRIRVKCWSSDSPMTCPTIWVGFETLPGVLIGTWTSLTLDAWRHYYFWIWPTTNMKRFALRNLHVGLFQPENQFLLYHMIYHYSL